MGYGKPQRPNSFIILDFETGGLDSNKNPATEIALLSIKGDISLDEIGRYQELIDVYDKTLIYDEKATKVTGITKELLEDEGKDINEVVDGVVDLMKLSNLDNPRNSPGLRPVLVGHNVGFDINYLHHVFEKRFGKSGQKEMESLLHGRVDHFGNFQPSYIDTWSLSKMWFGADNELSNFRLGTVVEKAGVELSDAHRAMNDVVATTDLLRAVIRNLRGGSTNGEISGSVRNKREGFLFPI